MFLIALYSIKTGCDFINCITIVHYYYYITAFKVDNVIYISKMLKGAHIPNVYLNCVLVEHVDSVKYHGHFLYCEISDDIDIRGHCRVINVRGNMLCRKFHMFFCACETKAF